MTVRAGNGEMEGGVWLWRQCRLAQGAQQAQRAPKTGKGKNGEVIVEKVMTSDSFLSREIKKAPLIEHDGSLVADISHIPNDLKITIQGAREHNLKNVDLGDSAQSHGRVHRPVRFGQILARV